ncbi:MAG TPA: DNA translocase FtsK 4TM domain-containing protein, partial [Sphingomicrobium sp.]|nr:DNA translocase FtsK 4TM domain-containing protein [Sphingomicrobium sp.]
MRVLFMRTVGALLLATSIAQALALATHNSVDPSFSTAAGGPPANWLGSLGAYSSDLLLMLFGLAAILILPVVAIAGLRLMRAEPAGRLGRSLLIAILGTLLVGVSLGLLRGEAVSGLPAGWGGALGLAGARGVDSTIALIGNPAI